MPSEVDEGKVSRHWHDEVKGIAVDDAFPHIVQLGHQTCGRREKEQRVKCGITLGLMGGGGVLGAFVALGTGCKVCLGYWNVWGGGTHTSGEDGWKRKISAMR